MARKTKVQEQERQEAVERLRAILKPGDTVYGIVRHVSRSGMSRVIDFYTFKDNDWTWLTPWMARALDMPRTSKGPDGLKVGGCGMDMIFATVYNLGRTLFPVGFGLPCTNVTPPHQPCNWRAGTVAELTDEQGIRIRMGLQPHTFRGRNGDDSGWDDDGGYALKAEAL